MGRVPNRRWLKVIDVNWDFSDGQNGLKFSCLLPIGVQIENVFNLLKEYNCSSLIIVYLHKNEPKISRFWESHLFKII